MSYRSPTNKQTMRLKLVKLVHCTMFNGKLFHYCDARYFNKLQIALLIT